MITHEHGMLVLDAPMTRADQDAVNSFVHEQILADRKRILDELSEHFNGGTLSIAVFKVKEIITQNKERY
jgi:hypothetical protein